MPMHAEKRAMPYSPEQMFELVADIERYPEFLPWCEALKVRRRDGNLVVADMTVGFKMFRERFTSKVTLSRPDRIDVSYEHGPFKYLRNHWLFLDGEGDGYVIDFYVDFTFRSRLLEMAAGPVFNEAVRRMVSAFEGRARRLYGRTE